MVPGKGIQPHEKGFHHKGGHTKLLNREVHCTRCAVHFPFYNSVPSKFVTGLTLLFLCLVMSYFSTCH